MPGQTIPIPSNLLYVVPEDIARRLVGRRDLSTLNDVLKLAFLEGVKYAQQSEKEQFNDKSSSR